MSVAERKVYGRWNDVGHAYSGVARINNTRQDKQISEPAVDLAQGR